MNSEKRNGLIGMRVIATLGIALYHFELSFPFVEGKQLMATTYLFVEFFFVMSGFFMAMTLSSKERTLYRVIIDRFVRLWPAYIMGLILLPVVYAVTWFNGDYIAWLNDGSHLKSFLVEIFMIQCTGIAKLDYINGPAWYVSAMFIVTPIVYIFIRLKRVGAIIAPIVAATLYILVVIMYNSPDMTTNAFIFIYIPVPLIRGLAGMLVGLTAYYLFLFLKNSIINMPNIAINILEGLFIIWMFRMCVFRQSSLANWFILIPIIGIIILMMAENRGAFSKLLGSKKLDYFAEISYSFYIMQSFCSNFFSCFLPDIKQPYSTLFYLILNFSMAVIVHEIFERSISHFLKNIFNFNRRSA